MIKTYRHPSRPYKPVTFFEPASLVPISKKVDTPKCIRNAAPDHESTALRNQQVP